jgi:large repetitive protein
MTKCFGQSNGEAIVGTAGGNYPYVYNWAPSSAETDSVVNTLAAGTHRVITTDFKGCKDTLNGIVVKQPDTLTLSFSQTNVTCFGTATGTARVVAVGGTGGAYTYVWTNGSILDSAIGLALGTHSVTVRDVNLCQKSGSVNITQPTLLISSKQIDSVRCNGTATGKGRVIPSGGTTPYTYLWSSGETTDSIINKTAGTYFVTTTDAKGCIKRDT